MNRSVVIWFIDACFDVNWMYTLVMFIKKPENQDAVFTSYRKVLINSNMSLYLDEIFFLRIAAQASLKLFTIRKIFLTSRKSPASTRLVPFLQLHDQVFNFHVLAGEQHHQMEKQVGCLVGEFLT